MRLLNATLWLIITVILVWVLVIGREFIVPFVLALFIWYLINTLAVLVGKLRIGRFRVPRSLRFAVSLVVILAAGGMLVNLVVGNIKGVIKEADTYQANMIKRVDQVIALPLSQKLLSAAGVGAAQPVAEEADATVAEGGEPSVSGNEVAAAGVEEASESVVVGEEEAELQSITADSLPALSSLFEKLDIGMLLSKVGGAAAGVAGNAGLILAYLMFIFLEQKMFDRKLRAFLPKKERRSQTEAILQDIASDIRTYVGVKTFVSGLTGLVSYVVLKMVGLDFAEFWAVLIFIFNFVPNVGSLFATLLPSVLALVQFPDSFWQAGVVLGGVGAIQLVVGNVIEPKMMGSSLNMSPLVIILSLVLWGSIWGLIGMFLCVPLMVVAMIILANFEQTRPIARLLSADGRLKLDSKETA